MFEVLLPAEAQKNGLVRDLEGFPGFDGATRSSRGTDGPASTLETIRPRT